MYIRHESGCAENKDVGALAIVSAPRPRLDLAMHFFKYAPRSWVCRTRTPVRDLTDGTRWAMIFLVTCLCFHDGSDTIRGTTPSLHPQIDAIASRFGMNSKATIATMMTACRGLPNSPAIHVQSPWGRASGCPPFVRILHLTRMYHSACGSSKLLSKWGADGTQQSAREGARMGRGCPRG